MDRNKIIIVTVVIILLLLGGVFLLSGRSGKKQTSQTTDNSGAIPTVDASVKVSIEGGNKNHEITLAVKGVPEGTETIDYELSYQTKGQGLQGLIGTVDAKGERDVEKTITLGTCSSGTCVYHEVTGGIQVSLKFTGSYGEKLFEKEFKI